MNIDTRPLISVHDLKVHFRPSRGMFGTRHLVRAVNGVSLDIAKGKTLGLVGESGCGKSTIGKAVLRLVEPTSGKVYFNGDDLGGLSGSELRARRRSMQMIFQDPYTSLNPKMTVGGAIGEPIRAHKLAGRSDILSRVRELMETVGLAPGYLDRYPGEFSGGQRQRIGIARALAVNPEFIVADEPISALDVSIQAQIMNLLKRLQSENDLTYLFISHDLRAVRYLSDRVTVMYLGRIVETGSAEDVYTDPLMPYTRALISAVPVADPLAEKARKSIFLKGDLPSPIDPPSGCSFHTRCPFAINDCRHLPPKLVEIKPRQYAACIRISREEPDIAANAAAGRGPIGGI